MAIFGKRTASPPREQVARVVATYFEGKLAALRLKEIQSNANMRKAIFALKADEAMASAGVAKLEDLPTHMIANLDALRAALFGDLKEFETFLMTVTPNQNAALREIRREVESHLEAEKQQIELAESARLVKGANKIDLTVLLNLTGRQDRRQRLLDWLAAQKPDPALWHEIATQSDPDGMHRIFLWIVAQPECDAATAAFIFHANNSFEALEYPDREATEAEYLADMFQIAKTIAERWTTGDFRTRRFSFDSMGYEEPLSPTCSLPKEPGSASAARPSTSLTACLNSGRAKMQTRAISTANSRHSPRLTVLPGGSSRASLKRRLC